MIKSTPAFVLRSFDFRETSKITTFYTRDDGKVKGILKGIRKDPRKFGTTLPLLSLNHLVFYPKRTSEIHLVGQCDLIDDFGLTQVTLENFGLSQAVAELVDILTPLEDPNRRLFELIFECLNSLKAAPARDLRDLFQIKALSLSGFRPHFDSCLGCDRKVSTETYFSERRGGLLCRRCLGQDRGARPLLPGTVASILYMERSGWSLCLRLQLNAAIRRELSHVLEKFLHFHAGKALKTDAVAHQYLDSSAAGD